MRDNLISTESLNDSFLEYAYESDKQILQSHSRQNSVFSSVEEANEQIFESLLPDGIGPCPYTFRLVSECSNIDSCYDDITESIEAENLRQQDSRVSISLQLQSTLQDIIAASAALKHEMFIDSPSASSKAKMDEMSVLQQRSLQLRLESMSFHCILERFVAPAFSLPNKPHHSRSLTPHCLDIFPGCSLALAARNSMFGSSTAASSCLSDYELLRPLSYSTMFGSIYLAQQKNTTWSMPVAIKCSEKSRLNEKNVEKFIAESPTNEIEILRWISMLRPSTSSFNSSVQDFYPGQQHICRMLQAGEDSQQIYCVLEYFPSSCDLQEYVLAAKHQRLCEIEARRIFWQLVQAVYYLHRIAKVAHLDLSLENVLLDGPQLNAFICDFGVAVHIPFANSAEDSEQRQSGFASTNFRPGKLSYMSGEVFSGRSFLASASDIYSLGVILLRLLCGPKVFAVTNPTSALWTMAIMEGRLDAAMEIVEADWDHVTESAKQLLARMLCPESRRAKVEDLIVSEWMRDEVEQAWKTENSVLVHLHEQDATKLSPVVKRASSK